MLSTLPHTCLKGRAIRRIKFDMIEDTIKQCQGFLIVIIDDYSAKILSSFLSLSQVINLGVFSVESLKAKRQPYPRYNALYFISPTADSCRRVAEDFRDEKKPMYSRAHIFFTHRILDEVFDNLIQKNLVTRVQTCKELNLSFLIDGKNLFDFGSKTNLKLFSSSMKKEDQNLYITQLMEKLITVCSVMQVYPNIQYQKSSYFCTRLADLLNLELNKLFKDKGKKGILLLTDRTFDPAGPLFHDYNYETMVYDFFKFENRNEIQVNGTTSKLDESDELWEDYKDRHLVEVFGKLSEDFEEFMKSDMAKVGKNKDLDNFDEMASVLKNMTGYKEKNRLFSLHLKIAEEVNNKFKNNFMDSILDLEQDILSGFDDKGHKISEKDIFKKFSLLKQKLERNEQGTDIVRLLGIIFTCLNIPEKDFNVLAGNSLSASQKSLFKSFENLGISFSDPSKKCQRRTEAPPKEEIKQIKQKLSKIEYKVLRSLPKISTIVEGCSRQELNPDEYAFVETPTGLPAVKKYTSHNIFLGNRSENEDDEEDKQNIIVFNIGGIAHNEIASLDNLVKEKKINFKVIIGSTGIYTASQYLKELEDLGSISTRVSVNNLDSSMMSRTSKGSKLDQTDIELQIKK